jgi:hypothetical protein
MVLYTVVYSQKPRIQRVSKRDQKGIENNGDYPLDNTSVSAAEGTSENNRRAKYYRLTSKGRKQLEVETTKWDKLARAIGRILRPAPEESGS